MEYTYSRKQRLDEGRQIARRSNVEVDVQELGDLSDVGGNGLHSAIPLTSPPNTRISCGAPRPVGVGTFAPSASSGCWAASSFVGPVQGYSGWPGGHIYIGQANPSSRSSVAGEHCKAGRDAVASRSSNRSKAGPCLAL
jgi:hypothetical protein